jgi:hypothetical protein
VALITFGTQAKAGGNGFLREPQECHNRHAEDDRLGPMAGAFDINAVPNGLRGLRKPEAIAARSSMAPEYLKSLISAQNRLAFAPPYIN